MTTENIYSSYWLIIGDKMENDIICETGFSIGNGILVTTGNNIVDNTTSIWIRETRNIMGSSIVVEDIFYKCKMVELVSKLTPSGDGTNVYKLNIIDKICNYTNYIDYDVDLNKEILTIEQIRRDIKIEKLGEI